MPSAETETPTPELMLVFYRRLYPFKSIFKWLNHEHTPGRLFTHREVAFTLQNDVYLRYNSFTTAEEFKKQTCTLNPTRFEIGPVYTARVRLSIDFLFPPRLSTPRC
jgi:DNA primase small subunit